MSGFEPQISDVGSDQSSNWSTTTVPAQLFFKWANPGIFFIYFRLFKQTLQILKQTGMWKNFHPVYDAGIQIHDLWNVSLHP